ncbi:MAG: group III truncated hemoglobin [Polaribacter sp.]|uniref:group III truncated hemoglobin n=1 Tax=Polaribacter sp. TaxID=1920175 RepID=UPI003BAF5047
MRSDISSREDIKLIITKFYDLLLADDNMLPFFKEIVLKNQLEYHLEIITDFWNDILFYTNSYQNNVLQKHLDKNTFIEFRKEHFSAWASYFFLTIDNLFEGEKSLKMKNRAQSIATVMQLKMKIYEKK